MHVLDYVKLVKIGNERGKGGNSILSGAPALLFVHK